MPRVWTIDEVNELMENKFGDLPLSKAKEQAECWIIDHNGVLPDENLQEIKANIKNANKGAKSDKPRAERKPREKDIEKLWLIKTISNCLKLYNFDTSEYKIVNVKIANEVKEITFTIGENEYSLNLVKHRTKK